MFLNKKRNLILILLGSDILMAVLAFFIAYFLRNKGPFRIFFDSVQPIEAYLYALPFAVLLLIATFNGYGLYKPRKRVTKAREIFAVGKAVSIWVLLIMAGSYLVKYDYSRIIVILFFFFILIFINIGRFIIRHYQFKMTDVVNVAIVGAGRIGRSIAEDIRGYHNIGFWLAGFIDDKTRYRETVKILGRVDELNEIIERYRIDEIYLADPAMSHKEVLNLVASCRNRNVEFKVISDLFELATGKINISAIEELPTLNLRKRKPGLLYTATKRLIDIAGASLGLALTSPLWLAAILIIKKDSPGPAIFIQERVGFNGKIFNLYKFRTMHAQTPRFAMAPTENSDPRVTRAGKYLRRMSLDELPQLINILKGEMSLVGPRPEMPFLVEQYEPWQRKRLEVKPGLTGLWQILGRKDIPLIENMEYDFYYINNLSLKQDILIILKTLPVLIFGKGAY